MIAAIKQDVRRAIVVRIRRFLKGVRDERAIMAKNRSIERLQNRHESISEWLDVVHAEQQYKAKRAHHEDIKNIIQSDRGGGEKQRLIAETIDGYTASHVTNTVCIRQDRLKYCVSGEERRHNTTAKAVHGWVDKAHYGLRHLKTTLRTTERNLIEKTDECSTLYACLGTKIQDCVRITKERDESNGTLSELRAVVSDQAIKMLRLEKEVLDLNSLNKQQQLKISQLEKQVLEKEVLEKEVQELRKRAQDLEPARKQPRTS